jgi:AcrR family transcriptional regulator
MKWPVPRVRDTVCHVKVDAVRRSSQVGAPQDKIAHPAGRRDPKPATGRDRRDSRWDEHRRARREQLVDAALAAVSRHGPGVGMEEIAAQAGTSKTVVYRHFADRSDLYVAVCGRVADRLLAELRAAMESGGPPRQMVTTAVDTYLAFCEADPQIYRFVVHGPRGHKHENGPDPVDRLSEIVAEEAAAALAAALTAAGRDPAVARPWGHGLIGLVRAAADWWLRADRPMLRSELAAHLTDLAWAGLSAVGTAQEEQ